MLVIGRRHFLTLLGGAAAWPLAARGQNVGMRRVIVLMGTADDAEAKDRAVALQEGLQKLRWTVGRDLQINYLFAAGSAERLLAYADEAVASKPDILLAQTNPAVKALQNVTRTLPIVFLQVSDPVGAGFVGSLAHPGGNITGFTNFEAEIGGKWLQRLKDIAPAVENVGFVFNPETSAHTEFVRAAEKASGALNVKIVPLAVHKVEEIDSAITGFASVPNGGMIVSPHPITRGKLIIDLASRYRLPTIYPFDFHVRDGGLVSYGVDQVNQFRSAATYVDRILKGEKPADLPVQEPVKYELVINLKTANALGLNVPPTLLAIADRVIE
jgi:putative tryptophan/tyrosine transport system substrate-binding protein